MTSNEIARFWSRVRKGDDCWEWLGRTSTNGYGAVWADKRDRRAHRVAWELVNGPIPDGLYVCHHCDNKRCVRPDHLFIGTATDNMQDALRKGRNPFRNLTHCPRGHPYDEHNTYTKPLSGWRQCRICRRQTVRAWLMRRRTRQASA
jgi:hypothetical protein